MFIGVKMDDDIPTKEDFIRSNIDLDRSTGWELISASTIMKKEFKYSGAKFKIVQSYLHTIDILFNPAYNNSYNPNLKIVSLISVWVPLLFLCRQAVELSLKNAKVNHRKVTKDDMKALYESCTQLNSIPDSTQWSSFVTKQIVSWTERVTA